MDDAQAVVAAFVVLTATIYLAGLVHQWLGIGTRYDELAEQEPAERDGPPIPPVRLVSRPLMEGPRARRARRDALRKWLDRNREALRRGHV